MELTESLSSRRVLGGLGLLYNTERRSSQISGKRENDRCYEDVRNSRWNGVNKQSFPTPLSRSSSRIMERSVSVNILSSLSEIVPSHPMNRLLHTKSF